MISLYGSGQSRSFRALWALEESGLEYEYFHTAIGHPTEGGSRHPSYLINNAQGKVPTLIDDNVALTESAAIINYVASRAPDKQLIPQDISLRAKYDEFCFFVLSDLEQPLWTMGKHKFVLPEEQRVENIFATTHWEFKRSVKALDQYMKGKEFAIDNQFTGADILLAQTINWAMRFEYNVPQVYQDFRARMYQRPACERALEKASP
ncbi:hypothetical protein ACH42_06680 [Endozoicomonas sp. (ex Bugula neritina AB1)]|nr:hypothetical protein ACH42_06680 [Endozoicomonas sp. (ex Bugula neritina AB1)]